MASPREEVGKMGYIVIFIAYVVLAVIGMARLGPGHT
jgi:hypothetical protein